jgi:hypothetical protein
MPQYVCSGSDDFSVYIWSIPGRSENIKYQNDVHLKLRGHRSIVNQVRYNSHYSLLATCGVEKSIRLWTPYRLNGSHGGLYGFRTEYEPERKLYASDELLELGIEAQPVVNEALVEDERMLAFFDSLVRKELANQVDYISDASTSSNDDETDTDDDDDDEKKSNATMNRFSDIIEFESDNEDATDNTSSSSSSGATTASGDISSNKPRNQVKLSLRDRLRNLQHRRTLNLTQNNEYKNVLSLLNVPFSSSSHETEQQDNDNSRINFQFNSIHNPNRLILVDDNDEADRSPNDTQFNLIRKFNRKRKSLLTSSAPQHDVQDAFNVEPSGSNEIVADVQDEAKVDFKKKSNFSRSYRASRADFREASSKSSSSSENEEVKHKWHKGS